MTADNALDTRSDIDWCTHVNETHKRRINCVRSRKHLRCTNLWPPQKFPGTSGDWSEVPGNFWGL
eukprot:7422277-Alexandrium_andersonii.AAC.1